MSEWMSLVPLVLVAVGGLIVMLVDAFSDKAEDAAMTSFVVLAAATLGSAALLISDSAPAAPVWVGNYLAVDKFAYFVDMAICGGAALSALLAGGYLVEHRMARGEFHVVILFSTLGAMILAHASDLITVFIGLETMSLGVYALCAYRRGSLRATESALKYFLLGSFAAAILLFGSALLYGLAGHTDFAGIAEVLASGKADSRLVVMSLLLLVVGIAFKVGAVPFHQWTPDVYEGAPTPVTAFMSVVVKTAAFALAMRMFLQVFGDSLSANMSTGWPPVMMGIAALSMVVGNFAALHQKNVKRMLGYSSIAHAGYILVALIAAPTVGERAISAGIFYLLAYTVSNILAFGSLIWLGSRGREAVSYQDLAGAGRRHPAIGLAFTAAILSLMGFPPTAGFIGKYYVFSAAIEAGHIYFTIFAILMSAVGAFYYLRVLVFLFMKSPESDAETAMPMRSSFVVAAAIIAGYFVIKMGVTPDVYIELAIEAAKGFVGA